MFGFLDKSVKPEDYELVRVSIDYSGVNALGFKAVKKFFKHEAEKWKRDGAVVEELGAGLFVTAPFKRGESAQPGFASKTGLQALEKVGVKLSFTVVGDVPKGVEVVK